jgi:hypothetical protein
MRWNDGLNICFGLCGALIEQAPIKVSAGDRYRSLVLVRLRRAPLAEALAPRGGIPPIVQHIDIVKDFMCDFSMMPAKVPS